MMPLNRVGAFNKIKWKLDITLVCILFAIHLQKGIGYLHTLNDFIYSAADDDVRWNYLPVH